MKLFAQMTKVNVAERTVEGVIADETVDLSGEVFDYASSKPHFEKWSEGIAKATGGKNLGNVRVMHGNAVAGVTKEMHFDDNAKQIAVKAYIADDNEWGKVQAGCYTGFSIGGSYAGKWDDPLLGKQRYTAKPTEYSLVDLPCNPGAQFTVIKAEGVEELHKFAPPSVDACIRKVLGDQRTDVLQKGLYTVSRLAELLGSLNYVRCDTEYEAANEGDGSTIPAELKMQVRQLGQILVRMTQEEVAELTADDAALARSVEASLKKHQLSEEDAMTDELKKKHDDAVAALATANDGLAKAATDLQKMTGERDELQKSLDTANGQLAEANTLMEKAATHIAEQAAIIKRFEDAPAPLRTALLSVSKSADSLSAPADQEPVMDPDGTVNKAATAIRDALQHPVHVA